MSDLQSINLTVGEGGDNLKQAFTKINSNNGKIENRITEYAGNPEGSAIADIGALCVNTLNGELYQKISGDALATGWQLITLGSQKSISVSSSVLSLDKDSNFFSVTGSSEITSITGRAKGIVYVKWNEARLLTEGASLKLSRYGSRQVQKNEVSIFEFSGGQVQEIGAFLNGYIESFTFLTKQFLQFSDKKKLEVKAGTKVRFETDIDVRYYTVNTDTILDIVTLLDTGSSLDVGKDYYVYLVKDGSGGSEIKVSLNSTYPDGYAADTSRKIGGFHTLCVDVGTISDHPLSDYVAGDILPQSVWCLSHRPVASPEGMVYIPETDSWVDIYLQSGTYDVSTDTLTTASEYGATVTDTRAWPDHAEDLFRANKRMLTDIEFSVAAEGSNQKTVISGAAEPSPKTSGGHVDTASRRMVSNYGVEECCGYLQQWLNESAPTGGSSWSNYDSLSGDKGQVYGSIYALLAGGTWTHGASCGSRCRHADHVRSAAHEHAGGRGASWTKAV